MALDETAKFAVAEIRDAAPHASGDLKKSIQILESGRLKRLIGSTIPYAVVVEKGRAAGAKAPPRAAIEKWGGAIGKEMKKGTARSAYIIAKMIGLRGIKPTFFFSGRLPEIIEKFEENADNVVGLFFGSGCKGLEDVLFEWYPLYRKVKWPNITTMES